MGALVYMQITTDEYELPVAVAESLDELSKIVGVTKTSIWHSINRRETGRLKGKSKYIRVFLDDEEEPLNGSESKS